VTGPDLAASTCVVLALVGVALDAGALPLPGAGFGALWLHIAAAVSLACAAWRLGGFSRPLAWSTPLDGLILASLAIATVGMFAGSERDSLASWFWQVLACSGVYVGIVPLLRRSPRGRRVVWGAIAVVCFVLGAHALWASTAGLGRLSEQAALADRRWAGSHVLAKTVAFVTLVAMGRALERGSAPLWRVAVLVGGLGTALHAAGGGFGLAPEALSRLDDPLYFSSASVTFLLAIRVARLGWTLRRGRPDEVNRWRGVAVAMVAVGVTSLLGESTGGEALRTLAVLLAAVVVAEGTAPSATRENAPVRAAEPAELEHAA
jgi:hypothetical protein